MALSPGAGTANSTESATAKSKRIHRSLLKKYTVKLISACSVRLLQIDFHRFDKIFVSLISNHVPNSTDLKDIWMGTQLLFVDIMIAMELVFKQLRGYNVTRRERYKLKRTLNDVGSLIPVTILMLLPVSSLPLDELCWVDIVLI